MNILFLYANIIDPEKGGVQRVTSVLADYFESQGHQVWYISLNRPQSTTKNHTRQLKFSDITDFDTPVNREQFRQVLKGKNIDIVINQGGQGPQTFPLVMLAKAEGCKIISVHHTTPLGKIYNFSTSFKNRASGPLQFLLPLTNYQIVKNILLHLIKRRYKKHFVSLCQESDRVLLLSEKFRKELSYFTDGRYLDNVMAISNPVSYSTQPNTSIKTKELLFVGRIETTSKRIDLLLQIWSKLHHKHPDWKLTIVGGGEQLDEMKAYAVQLDLKNISFEGFQNPMPYYKRASIFCMTSSYEGFGIVLVEAMQYGVVPFAFNSYAAVSDIIDDKKNGVLVTPFDTEEYACRLSTLMTNHTKRKIMSDNAIAKSNQFSIDTIGQRWIDLMNELISK